MSQKEEELQDLLSLEKTLEPVVREEMRRLTKKGYGPQTLQQTAIGLVSARCREIFTRLGKTEIPLREPEPQVQQDGSAEVVQGNFGQSASA